MMMQNLRAALLLPALALTACATMDQPAAVPKSTRLMSAADVSVLLSKPAIFNNGITGGVRYEFKPGGELAYSMHMLPAKKSGKWKLEGGRLCINVDDDPWESGNFFRVSATQYYFNLPEYDQQYNSLDLQ